MIDPRDSGRGPAARRAGIVAFLLGLLVGAACAGKGAPDSATAARGGGAARASESRPSMDEKRISASGYDLTPLPEDEVRELASELTPLQRSITLEAGTERPFTGEYLETREEGTYVCAVGDLPLFSSEAKFDSHCGWPSFTEPIDPEHVIEVEDRSHGMVRTEIRCARTGVHLGHVFDDGPGPTGKRYCLNSAALQFVPAGEALPEGSSPAAPVEETRTERATFGAGCFWGVEAAFRPVGGVVGTRVGYSGGGPEKPDYRLVCSGTTGHAEVVEVSYDPERVTFEDLLGVFWSCHDPTQLDRQGPDHGTQYRSAIFFHGEDQRRAALASREEQERSGRHSGPIVTQIVEAGPFWRAEEYHQQYLEKQGLATCPSHLR